MKPKQKPGEKSIIQSKKSERNLKKKNRNWGKNEIKLKTRKKMNYNETKKGNSNRESAKKKKEKKKRKKKKKSKTEENNKKALCRHLFLSSYETYEREKHKLCIHQFHMNKTFSFKKYKKQFYAFIFRSLLFFVWSLTFFWSLVIEVLVNYKLRMDRRKTDGRTGKQRTHKGGIPDGLSGDRCVAEAPSRL